MKSKTFLLIVIAFITMSFNNSALTDAERKFASDLLQQTQENLIKKVSGLSPEQLNFKADANSWSVAECVEHLAIAESNLFGLSQASLKEPADPSKRKDLKMTDEALVATVADRSKKASAPESFKPSGKFGSFEATLNEFKTKRRSNIEYIKTTSDDLRNHYNEFPFGKLDAYQTILLMASHSKRHTDQIEEVMNHPNFPKKGK